MITLLDATLAGSVESLEMMAAELQMSYTCDSQVPMDGHLVVTLSQVLSTPQRRKALRELKGNRAQLLVDFLHSVHTAFIRLPFCVCIY